MPRVFILLFVGIVLSVSGELLLKHGMNNVGTFSLQPSQMLSGLTRTFSNPYILLGFALVFTASIFWLSVISRIPLSIAYPMLSLSYVIVVFAAWLLLRESISVTKVLGVLVIISGVALVYRS